VQGLPIDKLAARLARTVGAVTKALSRLRETLSACVKRKQKLDLKQ